MGLTGRGRYHIQGLLSSVEDYRKQINGIGGGGGGGFKWK